MTDIICNECGNDLVVENFRQCLECLEAQIPSAILGHTYKVRWYTLFTWVLRAVKAEQRLALIKELHRPRHGMCPECITRTPCATLKSLRKDWKTRDNSKPAS